MRHIHAIQYAPIKIHQIFEIICAIHNAFGNPLYSDDGESMEEDVTEMHRRQQLENNVFENEGKNTGWKRGDLKKFRRLDFIPDFDLHDRQKIACGAYV